MLKTSEELKMELARRIGDRRLALGWTQRDAAARSGIAYMTWRRLETEGSASILDLIRAALALRCEEGLETLFPLPAASSMDALLAQQARAQPVKRRRAPNRSKAS